jgi:hypothetical protein
LTGESGIVLLDEREPADHSMELLDRRELDKAAEREIPG